VAYTITNLLAGGRKMPDIFKALATITAWVLFICGWLLLVVGSIVGPAVGGQFFGSEPPAIEVYLAFTVTIACFILAVVVMGLRQKME
jgi:tellurite resistance protein TehA-like permease